MAKQTRFDRGRIVKHKTTGFLYTIEHVVHSTAGIDAEDTFACYRLSGYDGMPTGPLVHLTKNEVE